MRADFHWLEDLRYARSARDLERCVRYFATEHGLPYFGFTAQLIGGHAEDARVSFHNFSRPWAQHYAQLGRVGNDPRIEAAERAYPAVAWCSDGRVDGLLSATPARTLELIAEAASHGLHAGVAVPWRGRGVRWAFLSFSQDQPRDPQALLAQTALAQYLCSHLIDALTRLRGRSNDRTGQAMDALAWYAAGDSMHEIAGRLNVSYHTIRTYLRRVCEQLGARNVSHAVALALRRGLIS
jgi:DNA-binding CsgD family transcriptional regulator